MKKYIKPELKVSVCDSIELFCTSGTGETNSFSFGNEYSASDVSYVREEGNFDIWGN